MTTTADLTVARSIADPAQALLFERELSGLRAMTWARTVLLALWAPLAWAFSFGVVDLIGSLVLLTLYLAGVIFSHWAISHRRHQQTVGLLGCVLDIMVIALLPVIWYQSLGGSELPVGILFKSAVSVLALMLIALSTLAVRPLYPALVTGGAITIHSLLLWLAINDPQTTFTTNYVVAYTLPPTSVGKTVTDFVVLAFAGAVLTKLTRDARAMVIEATELEKTNTQLGRYFSPNLVARLAEHPHLLGAGAERRELSFVFTDLAGFTAMVERESPADLVPALNEYLDGMVRIAFEHQGTVDKIVGDAVHVMFSAPVEQADHAHRAVDCALAMDAFAEGLRQRKDAALTLGATRIGVTTGTAVVGNFGGDALFDYTAHGEAINLAARLEAANKPLGTRVCISGATVAKVPDFAGRPVGTLTIRGARKPIDVFEPLPAGHPGGITLAQYIEAFDRLRSDDPRALAAFEALARTGEDPVVRLHLERLRHGGTGTLIDLSSS